MNAELKIDCKNCFNDIVLELTIKGKPRINSKEIIEGAKEQGWSIGRDCYCPSCYRKLPAHCDTCDYFEGNKTMGSSLCRRDGEFTTATDYCKFHTPNGPTAQALECSMDELV